MILFYKHKHTHLIPTKFQLCFLCIYEKWLLYIWLKKGKNIWQYRIHAEVDAWENYITSSSLGKNPNQNIHLYKNNFQSWRKFFSGYLSLFPFHHIRSPFGNQPPDFVISFNVCWHVAVINKAEINMAEKLQNLSFFFLYFFGKFWSNHMLFFCYGVLAVE